MENASCKDCGFIWEAYDFFEECPCCGGTSLKQTQHEPPEEEEEDES